jgi:hypothetical protein
MGKGALGVKHGEGKFKKAEKAAWMREYQQRTNQRRNYKESVRAHITDIKRQGCALCGYSKCVNALEFHHVGDDKTIEMSSVTTMKRLNEELPKCIVVCANCHREIHAGQIEGYENVKRAAPVAAELPLLRLINS